MADRNAFGVTGIIYDADLGMVNACRDVLGPECEYALEDAIDIARANTAPGDIILIEQQTSGPSGPCALPDYPYIPVEYYQVWFDAIQMATADGRIVVEAAGNGGCNLDNAAYGGLFNRAVRDSGAIIVGAGAAPGCTSPARSRLSFSCYGSRLDVQGWGECVVTTGYGDLYAGAGPNEYYTAWFSGTSSASPIVAGAAGSLQSACFASTGSVLSPATVRQILVDTGTPQDMSVAGHIGPLPDLAVAVQVCPPAACVFPNDADCDACYDSGEPGLVPPADPADEWDFYDVPVPTLYSGGHISGDPSGTDDRDHAISIINDVLAVLEYSGTSDGGPPNAAGRQYNQDVNGDGVDDGIAYDRSVGATRSGAPDGVVTIIVDVLLVLAQSGHSCQAP